MNLYKNLSKEGYISIWMIFLYASVYTTNTLKKDTGGNKSDFERWLLLRTPNMNFRRWCEGLISEGIIVSVGHKLICGVEHEIFLINKKKLREKIRESKVYQIMVRHYLDTDVGSFYDPPKIKGIRKLFKEGDI